eukprot:g10830.t1
MCVPDLWNRFYCLCQVDGRFESVRILFYERDTLAGYARPDPTKHWARFALNFARFSKLELLLVRKYKF